MLFVVLHSIAYGISVPWHVGFSGSLIEPVLPALEGGILTIEPLRKSLPVLIYQYCIHLSQIVFSPITFLGNKCSVISYLPLQLESKSQGILSFHLSSACVLCICLTYPLPMLDFTSHSCQLLLASTTMEASLPFSGECFFFIPKANVTLDCGNRSIFEILYLFWLWWIKDDHKLFDIFSILLLKIILDICVYVPTCAF